MCRDAQQRAKVLPIKTEFNFFKIETNEFFFFLEKLEGLAQKIF